MDIPSSFLNYITQLFPTIALTTLADTAIGLEFDDEESERFKKQKGKWTN